MANIKISIIGAGSAVFSLNLVRDICLTPSLGGSTINFMDIDKDRLDAVYSLCKRYADEMGIKLNLEKTLSRRESLRDADFVINTALVAGHDRLREGWSVAIKHGYGYGGSLHIMHDEAFWVNFYQFKLFDSVLNDIMDICPDAWYIQSSNPVLASITYEARKYKEIKTVGLCNGYRGIYNLAGELGLDSDHITYEIIGVNHFAWLTRFYCKGEDAFPILDKWIEEEMRAVEEGREAPSTSALIMDLYRRFGMYMVCCHGDGNWPWWYYANDETRKRWGLYAAENWNRYFAYIGKHLGDILKVAGDPSEKVSSAFPPEKSTELTIPVIESIACDLPRVLQTNIQNTSNFIPGLPMDFEVEIPALVGKRGIQGIQTRGLPKPIISYILRDRVAPVEIELDAYETGCRERLLELIMMDPWSRSEEQAMEFLDDILALPNHEEMRQHYK